MKEETINKLARQYAPGCSVSMSWTSERVYVTYNDDQQLVASYAQACKFNTREWIAIFERVTGKKLSNFWTAQSGGAK